MRTVDILEKKRDGEELSESDIRTLVSGYCEGTIPDYQMSAFAMAVVWHGMTLAETAALTQAMIESGDTISLTGLARKSIDKHSTGGVGDKTTLVVAPLVASLGFAVPKLSGRGLGHTGGTLDKLESIPGYTTMLARDRFLEIVNTIGVAVASPTENIVPADQLLYALRDATATVRSLPLIASSILSKKFAVETDAISLDVKVGEGAFFRTLPEAREFAALALKLGELMHRNVHCMLSSMDDPLGNTIGNSLEVKEALDTLHGHGPDDFTDLCVTASRAMVQSLDPTVTEDRALAMIREAIDSGTAFACARKWFQAQGGDLAYIDDPSMFPQASRQITVEAEGPGTVTQAHALRLGHLAMQLGAGRETKDDVIDHAAGIVLHQKRGSVCEKGTPLATLHTNMKGDDSAWRKALLDAFVLEDVPGFPQPSPVLEMVEPELVRAR